MLTRKTLVLVKEETSYGVDPTPTPTANALQVRNLAIKPVSEELVRDFYRNTLSPMEFVRGEKYWQVTFEAEMKGTGTAGVLPTTGWVGPLLKACGMAEDVGTEIAYSLLSDNHGSAAIYAYKDGLLRKILGCRGTFGFTGEVGKYGVWNFDLLGIYAGPADASPGSATWSTVKPPVWLSSSLSVGGYAHVVEKFDFKLGNQMAQRRDMNAATGLLAHIIAGREPSGSFDPEATLEATHAFWAKWASAEAMALNIGPVGSVVGNQIQITGPKLQYSSLADADKNGIFKYEVGFKLAGDEGDDELVITFS